jgi:2-phosphoglycerate kinase
MKTSTYTYSREDLKKEILEHARSLRLAPKWAETIAEKTAKNVDVWIEGRGIVTEADIRRIAHQTLKKLSSDIAFVYKNYDKII